MTVGDNDDMGLTTTDADALVDIDISEQSGNNMGISVSGSGGGKQGYQVLTANSRYMFMPTVQWLPHLFYNSIYDSGVPVADSLLNDFVSAFKRTYPQDNVNIDNSHDCMCMNPLLTMHLHQYLCKCNVHEGDIITSAIDT